MHSEKKLTKEDTWRPEELRRHIMGRGLNEIRRRDENDRRYSGGESTERRHRDPEKESRQERDKHREREHTRERRDDVEKDRYTDRRKEGSRDRRGDKERDRRDERERERRREIDKIVDEKRCRDHREERDRKRDREEKHDREKDKERHRDREKERERDKERHRDREKERERDKDRHRDREKERESDKERHRDQEKERERDKDRHRDREKERESDKERHRDRQKERDNDKEKHYREDREKRREDGDKEKRRDEHRTERERRRHEERRDGDRDRTEKHEKEKRERHRERLKDEYEDKRNDKERRERDRDRKHSENTEDREEHRRHKEDRERRHPDRRYHDVKRKHDSESRDRQGLKGSDDEVRHHRSDRERTERDTVKEGRHREQAEEGLERNHHRDRTKTFVKIDKHETKTEDVAIACETRKEDTEKLVDNAEDQVEEYEDDFEDYEEDFEEMDASENEGEEDKEPQQPEEDGEGEELTQRRKEIEAIQRAMDEENERVGTAQSRRSTSRDEEDEPKWTRGSEKIQRRASQGKFIDFVAAKQREVSKKVATKQKKRSTELLRLIDMDFSMTHSLLDLPPVNEYDMYIRSFGAANTKQAYVQCNEDNVDRDIQTEETDVCEKWTQHPPEHFGACGDPNFSQEARDRNMREINFDSQRLTAFLHSASQVMTVLLEEDQAERRSLRKLKSSTDALSFSDGSLQLNTKLPFLYGRNISLVHFSQVQKHTMMSVHDPTTKPSAVRLDSCTIICIWNIREPSRPQKVLVYESEVQCCCFSPGKAILVFAGTSVGSVLLWDLREHARNHHCLKIGEEEWTFRQPTFSTDAVMAGHLSSVTSVEVVPSAAAGGLGPEVPVLASEEELSGLSFQLASLDESGVLNFWVVVELPKASEAGSQRDLGLRPGGKVKLLHSSSLHTAQRVSPLDAVKTGPVQALSLKFLQTDSNHFFIGTSMGLVNHGTSHGLKAPPKFYRFQEAGVRPVDVSSIHFSPFLQHLFLVGCGDGSIRLHAVSHEQPVAEWMSVAAGERVVSLQWTQTRPTVFCVLDAASNLHMWDLMKRDSEPLVTERIHSDRVTAMAVFGDSGQQNTYSGIALAHESGKIEMQYFSRNFTVPILDEVAKLESMMGEAF